jgi:hypothetical protein
MCTPDSNFNPATLYRQLRKKTSSLEGQEKICKFLTDCIGGSGDVEEEPELDVEAFLKTPAVKTKTLSTPSTSKSAPFKITIRRHHHHDKQRKSQVEVDISEDEFDEGLCLLYA